MDDDQLQLLIIDDSTDDATRAEKHLTDAGYKVQARRISTAKALERALDEQGWTLILSEFSLLQCNAKIVLDTLAHRTISTPVIILTRAISDANYETMMLAGVRDIVRKNDIIRLAYSIRRELTALRNEQALELAQTRLADLESQQRSTTHGAQAAYCYSQEGIHLEASPAYLELFGLDDQSGIDTLPVLELIDKQDHKSFKSRLAKVSRNELVASALEVTGRHRNGSSIDLSCHFRAITHHGEPCVQISFEDISKRKATEQRLHYLTERDPLTGLYNRAHFIKLLKSTWEQMAAGAPAAALLYFDLYGLKEISSRYSYTTADGLLLNITKRLTDKLDKGNILARFGDEELMVLLPDQAGQNFDDIKHTLQTEIDRATIMVSGARINCDYTCTMTAVDQGIVNPKEAITRVLKLATEARPTPLVQTEAHLEAAPQHIEPVTPTDTSDNKNSIDSLIETALKHEDFRLYFQPTVCMQGDNDEIFEVLLRIVDSNFRLIPPRIFIPSAMESGRIADIDRWVVRRILETIAALHSIGRKVTYFVNTALPYAVDSGLIEIIREDIEKWNMPPAQLVLELEDEAVSANIKVASKFISAIAEMGVSISLDSAESITSCLPRLPKNTIRYLKFDAAAVSELRSDNERSIFASALEIARDQNIKLIASRVESASTLAEIWPYGFDYVQGHYFRQAGSELDFDFITEDEATLSGDAIPAPAWTTD